MVKINTFNDIKGFKEEERRVTVANFKTSLENLTADYRHGLCSEETYYKEICKLISRTGLHIDLNNL